MSPLLLAMPGNELMASLLAAKLSWPVETLELSRFPDGEAHVTIAGDLKGRSLAVVSSLDRPDTKLLPLVFAADAARDLGARKVGLVAPYLAYMRQDKRFRSGEAITAPSFARIISSAFDWLVTVEPHLHRVRALSEIYSIPTTVVHASTAIAAWVKQNVHAPLFVGPDAESAKWVAEAAAKADAPFTILEKRRTGDRSVEVRLKETAIGGDHTPVLCDDIVSTGTTMVEAISTVRRMTSREPLCIAVHALFAPGASEVLAQEKARMVTCNTVAHPTNRIDVSDLLAAILANETQNPSAG